MFFFLFVAISLAVTSVFEDGILYVTNLEGMYEKYNLGECFEKVDEDTNEILGYYYYTAEYENGREKIKVIYNKATDSTCDNVDSTFESIEEEFKKYSRVAPLYDSEIVVYPPQRKSIDNPNEYVVTQHIVTNACMPELHDSVEYFAKVFIKGNKIEKETYPTAEDCLKNQNKDAGKSKTIDCNSGDGKTTPKYQCGYDADDYVTTGTIYVNNKDNDASGYFEVHLGTCFYSEKNGNDDIYMEFVKQGNNYITLSYKNSECEGVPYPDEFGGEVLSQKPTTEVKVALLADDLQCTNKVKDEVGAILYYAVDKCLQVMEGQYVKTALANNKFSITYHTDAQCKNPYVSQADKDREFKCNECNTGYYADCDLSDGAGVECHKEKHEKVSDDKKSCVCVEGYEKKDGKCVSGAFSTFILAVLAILFFFF